MAQMRIDLKICRFEVETTNKYIIEKYSPNGTHPNLEDDFPFPNVGHGGSLEGNHT